jgi:hypothetical protein
MKAHLHHNHNNQNNNNRPTTTDTITTYTSNEYESRPVSSAATGGIDGDFGVVVQSVRRGISPGGAL